VPAAPDATPYGEVRPQSVLRKRPIRLGSDRSDGRSSGASSDPVRMYLKEIGRVPLLTAPEEVDLAKRIESGSLAAEKLADLSALRELDTLGFSERRRLQRMCREGEQAKSEPIQANLRHLCCQVQAQQRTAQ